MVSRSWNWSALTAGIRCRVNGKVRLQVLVDCTSLEIFGNDGLLYMPMAAKFAPDDPSLVLTVSDATVHFDSLEVNELRSIWP